MTNIRLTFATLLLLLLSGCTTNNIRNNMDPRSYHLPQDCDFTTLANNSFNESDCSPQLGHIFSFTFQGILINGPQRVEWPKEAINESPMISPTGNSDATFKLVIPGYVEFSYPTLGLKGEFAENILLVAVNQDTAESYRGKISRFGFTSKVEGFDAGEEYRVGQYFNIDLVQNLRIPFASARYTIYATLGDYKSNVITVETVVK